LRRIDYSIFPVLDPKTNGRFGQVEVMGTPDGTTYYRVFGRGKEGQSEIRSSGRTKPGERSSPSAAPGPADDDHLRGRGISPSGVEKEICVPMVLPQGKMGEGSPPRSSR
jgi:hypothetical protein